MTEKTKAPRIKSIAEPTGTFPVEITVRKLDGTEGTITFDCIARTQTAWAREQDAITAEARQRAAADAPEQPGKALESEVAALISREAGVVQRIAQGWDLDDPFAPESIAAMEDTYPGAIGSLVTAYASRVYGNRLGN